MIPKFRAWDKENGVMRKVKDISFSIGSIEVEPIEGSIECRELYAPILFEGSYELMQYTGFKDKKGIEIYVGDYIKYLGKTYRVISNFTGAFVGKMKKLGEEEVFVCYIYSECEVIGSILEDGDLLDS